MPWNALVTLLSSSLGREKSQEVLAAAATELSLPIADLDLPQAMAVLEKLGNTQGLVGVVSRFAKARAILTFSGSAQH